MACLFAGRAFSGGDGIWRLWLVEVCLCSLFILLPDSSSTLWFLICNRFLYKPFLKNYFVDLKESTSLRVEIPVEVRLPTAGSPQTPRKRDPHWEFVVVVVVVVVVVEQ